MNNFAKSLLLNLQIFRDLREGRDLRLSKERPLAYPIVVGRSNCEVHSSPRYGYGKPPHPELFEILNAGRAKYAETLCEFLQFKTSLEAIPIYEPEDPEMPYWRNPYFDGGDAVSLYAFACLLNPQTYIEIGSGNSTKVSAKSDP